MPTLCTAGTLTSHDLTAQNIVSGWNPRTTHFQRKHGEEWKIDALGVGAHIVEPTTL